MAETDAQQRYYDAEIGRFISPDPVGPEEDFVNHFNRYNYAFNNPTTYIDPDGRQNNFNSAYVRSFTGASTRGGDLKTPQNNEAAKIAKPTGNGKQKDTLPNNLTKKQKEVLAFRMAEEYENFEIISVVRVYDHVEQKSTLTTYGLLILNGISDFTSLIKLKQTLDHEIIIHGNQMIKRGMKDADNNAEMAADEVQAYRWNLDHAKEYGSSQQDIENYIYWEDYYHGDN